MSNIINIEKIPEEIRALVEAGLTAALKKGSLGRAKIDSVQIENSLSGGKTGAAVFVARYGVTGVKKGKKKAVETEDANPASTTFIRVLKIAPREVCESENEGYVKTRETLLDIFSQVEYYQEDEFKYKSNDPEEGGSPKEFGILLYQDVGTVAASALKGVAKFLTQKIITLPAESEEIDNFSKELSLLLQKEVFLSLKKGLYGNLQRKDVNLSEYYGDKLSKKVKEGILELKKIDPSVPDVEKIVEMFNIRTTYHQVNYIHGDLNPENVLVWENERGFLSCKLIDFGEVIPKKKDNFTPLFWDFSRLIGEMILNFAEESVIAAEDAFGGDGKAHDEAVHRIEESVDGFWSIIESIIKGNSSAIDSNSQGVRNKTDKRRVSQRMKLIAKIYISTLFDFVNEAKSGIKDLRRADVLLDYFFCQILFFFFFAKFQKENPFKRLFGVKLALKMYGYARREIREDVLISSLEQFYFTFSGALQKNKQPQIGPAPGARSPYMGLSYFQEQDKEFFFGRERFTEELIKGIAEKPVIALAGASGSGKSSVVHAGVFPLLRENNYLIYKFRPGSSPYQAALKAFQSASNSSDSTKNSDKSHPAEIIHGEKEHSRGEAGLFEIIKQILESNPERRIFLLGDQFEELFTLCKSDQQKENLGAAILECAKEFKDRFRFFITIRSDFWTKLLEEPAFSSIVGDSGDNRNLGAKYFLSPMNIDELRSAIESPLKVSGLKAQEGLTDLILTSISKEPGSLPLLEFCLNELWKRQVDYTLTYESYKQIGEVKGALATYADQVYSELNPLEREHIKKVMLQLIQPGQNTEDTRRVALIDEIVSSGDNLNIEFIYKIVNKRLIVTGTNESGEQTLEVAHEALIRQWNRLRVWIDADREFRVWQEKLRYSLKEWDANNREEGFLLRGSSIVNAEEWYNTRKKDLGQREIEYIEQSVSHRDWLLKKEKEEEEREKRNQKLITIGSVTAAIIAITLSWFAVKKMKDAEANELKSEAYAIQGRFDSKKNYLQNYYAMVKAGFEGIEISGKYSQSKLTILSTLYSFVYKIQEPEWSEEPEKKIQNVVGERLSLTGHNASVLSVNTSPDGKLIASGSEDRTIKIWDIAEGKEVKTLYGHNDSVMNVLFSPDGKTLASASEDNTIKIWDLAGGKEILTLEGHKSSVLRISFSPDGNILASGSEDKTIKLWDLTKGKEIRTLKGHRSPVWSVAFSPDGKTLASGSEDKTIKIWSIPSGNLMRSLSAHKALITSIAFSPDGKTLASGSYDNTVKTWNIVTGQKINTLYGHYNSIWSVAFSPDGKTLVSGSYDNSIKVWDLLTGKDIRTLYGHNSSVLSVVFTIDGKNLISGSSDSTIKFWDLTPEQEIRTLTGHSSFIMSIAFSPDGKTLASGSYDNTIKIWNFDTGKEINTLAGHASPIWTVDYSPDGKMIASGSSDNTIKFWDVSTGKEIRTLYGHGSSIWKVSFSPDGKTLASSSYDKTIKLWNVSTGKEIRTLSDHNSSILCLAFSPDGKYLATGSFDKTIKYWSVSDGKEIHTLYGHSSSVWSVAFSPDGKTLASGSSDNTIKFWNLSSGEEYRTFSGHNSLVTSIVFSHDGKTFASGSSDNTIKLWDLSSEQEIRTLYGHTSSVLSIAFSPDGKTLASGSYDKTIKLWDAEISALLPLACEDLSSQLNSWLTLANPPYPKDEILDIQKKCAVSIDSKPAMPLIKEEYSFLEKARLTKGEESIANYKEALKLNPDFYPAIHDLSEFYYSQGKYEEVLELETRKEYFYLKRARASSGEEKINFYKKALEINPELIPAREELARLYFDAGKEEEAFSLDKHKEYLYLYRARKTEDRDKKISDYQKALEINPKFQPAKIDLANLYADRGTEHYKTKEYDKSIPLFKKAIEYDPENHSHYDYIAWMYAVKDNPTPEELQEALEYSKKSNDMSPDNLSYLDTLAEVYLKLGDTSKAKKINDESKKIAEEKGDSELLKSIEEREGKLNGK